MKRKFSSLTFKEVMQMLNQETITRWTIEAPPRPPGIYLTEALMRFEAFATTSTEAAKILFIDTLLMEIVPLYPRLKVWKGEPMESDTLTGRADYLVAPKRAYLEGPLLCVAEAKRDDFEQGRAQCLGEMLACRWNKREAGHDTDVFGIVSNGQVWQFYKLALSGEVFETAEHGISDMPGLLGVLAAFCAECAAWVP